MHPEDCECCPKDRLAETAPRAPREEILMVVCEIRDLLKHIADEGLATWTRRD